MGSFEYGPKSYVTDDEGFLIDRSQWDDAFAEGMASACGIVGGLTPQHRKVIGFIRECYREYGRCPLVYQTCKLNGLKLTELQSLFPTGYLRGACRLAGISYRDSCQSVPEDPHVTAGVGIHRTAGSFLVDECGFLLDPDTWTERFAVGKAAELEMLGLLSKRHWDIIRYLRKRFQETQKVPTVYETCETNHLTIEELETLFPTGYHRGAVKIAGLRVR